MWIRFQREKKLPDLFIRRSVKVPLEELGQVVETFARRIGKIGGKNPKDAKHVAMERSRREI